ncbi:MAG: hypothetical protein IJ706_10725 [Clostridia bacterium]|nr:hypothetical protein [Clostridia bacterium]
MTISTLCFSHRRIFCSNFVLVIALLVSPFAVHKAGILIGNGIGFITGSIHFKLMAEANYNKQKAKMNGIRGIT